jgi:hypothetical protein
MLEQHGPLDRSAFADKCQHPGADQRIAEQVRAGVRDDPRGRDPLFVEGDPNTHCRNRPERSFGAGNGTEKLSVYPTTRSNSRDFLFYGPTSDKCGKYRPDTNTLHTFMHSWRFRRQENQVTRCFQSLRSWRRRGESNPRIKVLQTLALPLGYSAARANRGHFRKRRRPPCQPPSLRISGILLAIGPPVPPGRGTSPGFLAKYLPEAEPENPGGTHFTS